jgi:Uma2 family endonuclease
METELDQILKSPRLYEYLKIIQQTVETEQQKRQRFYNDITEQEKAEFINGEIICHSPVKNQHSEASENLFNLIKNYVILKKLGKVRHEKALIQLTRNDYEPDICYFKKIKSDKFSKNLMFYPAPDFIAEVLSDSTKNRDRGIKLEDYALHGVEEYWIVDPENEFVEQYILNNNNYELFLKSNSGNIKSFEIEGFEIPIQSIFNEQQNIETIFALINH